jgi:hypothetical protein
MRTILLASLCMVEAFMTQLVSAQEPDTKLSLALQSAKERLASECDRYTQLASTATREFEIQQAKDGQEVVCGCVPAEFNTAARRLAADQAHTPEERAQRVALVALQACGTKHLRASALAMCRADTKPSLSPGDRESYCQCFQKGLNGISDEQLTSDALLAYEHYEASVKAVADGQPRPPSPESSVSRVEAKCLASTAK